MLKDAFQYLFEQGRAAAPAVVRADCEPADVYYLRRPDGSLEKHTAEPGPRQAKAHSLQAVCALAVEQKGVHPEIWYGPDHVTALLGERNGTVTLPLAYSDQFNRLSHLKAHRPPLTQAEIVRELRTTFRDALGPAGNLVEVLRRVRFNATATTEGEVGHGRASLGKQIAGEVTGTAAIPEYVTLTFPVYATPCFRVIQAHVECALEPDPGTGTFKLIPLPGELESAVEYATQRICEEIGERLDGEEIPVYHGRP